MSSYKVEICGVNTAKLDRLERFVKRFPIEGVYMTADDLHTKLDEIAQTAGSYTPLQLGLASALACGAFTFLLGGGPIEMLLAFLGAGVGQYVRARLTQRHLTLFGCIALSVAAACLVYAALFQILGYFISTLLAATVILLIFRVKKIWAYPVVYAAAVAIWAGELVRISPAA